MKTRSTMVEESIYRRSADVVCRQVGLESILVPIRHNVGNLDYVYTLSPVAAKIWSLVDGTRSIAQIAEELSHEFDVAPATAAADVAALLEDLAGASLVAQVS